MNITYKILSDLLKGHLTKKVGIGREGGGQISMNSGRECIQDVLLPRGTVVQG